VNYEPEVIVQAFIRFNPGRSFVLQDLVDFDQNLFDSNDQFIVAALSAQGVPMPSKFDRSRVVQYAVVSPGDFSAAIILGASSYVRALQVGAIR